VAQFDGPASPAPEAVNDAFGQACHGGQLGAARSLLGRGADPNAVPGRTTATPLDIATTSGADELVA
jgi:hypothetical protein